MLNQTDIYTYKTDVSGLWSDLSVKIHGYIMSRIDTEYASELHSGSAMPFANYTVDAGDCYITRISSLDERSKCIPRLFRQGETIRIFGTDTNLRIAQVSMADEISVKDLPELLPANKYRLSVLTPAMYKSAGKPVFAPSLTPYFESVRQRLEKFEGIEISREMLYSEFEKVKLLDYSVSSAAFISGGKRLKGMTGSFDVCLPQSSGEPDILRILLGYATYSGIGGQTTQGMGGFVAEKL